MRLPIKGSLFVAQKRYEAAVKQMVFKYNCKIYLTKCHYGIMMVSKGMRDDSIFNKRNLGYAVSVMDHTHE